MSNRPSLMEFREYLLATMEEAPRGGILRTAAQNTFLQTIVDLIDDYSAEQAEAAESERIDPLSRSYLGWIAKSHDRAQDEYKRARLLDEVADNFTLYDVHIIRNVAAALADAMPRMAHTAREEGMSPDDIAKRTGYTASRVAQFIRQEKEHRAAPPTRYTWRIDVHGTDGRTSKTGEADVTPANLYRLAERLLAETSPRNQARIHIWKGSAGDDTDAVYRELRPKR
ncbi:hypothetical protein ACFY0P_36800 [Streptomyces sp. NPDC001714]|uniref:hypothetical protein n=1 Tax=Streptomyces sp. NPDC001714 TaxID=3364603 RepID=UPI003676D885